MEAKVASLETYLSDREFDLIVATDVVEHIEDDRGVMRRISALCHGGSRVVITVPAIPSLFGFHDEVLGHFRRYSRRQLKDLVLPFIEIQLLRYYGFSLIPVALVLSKWLRRPYPVAAVGNAEKSEGFLGRVIRLVFRLECTISPPLGISLLLIGRVR